MQDNALRLQGLDHRFPDVMVEPAQRQRLAIDEMHLGAQGAENAGEFNRDIAGADHDDMPRHCLQVERVVRNDAEFGARDIGTLRVAAGRDDDLLRGDPLAGDLDRVGIDQYGAAVEHCRARAGQQLAVDTLQPGDLAVLGGDQLAPVVRAFLDRPAEPGGIFGPTTILTGLHQQLLRHAANIDARAAPVAFLGDADTGAMAG